MLARVKYALGRVVTKVTFRRQRSFARQLALPVDEFITNSPGEHLVVDFHLSSA